jgi:glycerophosphoryl diester phosphodiesterase
MLRSPLRPATLGAWIASALLIALALPAPSPAAPTDWTTLRTLNIAHQGGEDEAPSNTMYALERAMRLGADMLELDIHTSADGELVVLHDGTVDRTTNGSGSVYDMSLAEIQALDAGHNTVPGEGTESGRPESDYPFRGVRLGEKRPPPGFRRRDFRIPTLGEVMAAYPDVPVNIEIKGAADTDVASFFRNADALAAFLNDLGRSEGIVVASFNDAALQRFHQAAPQIDLAPGTAAVATYKLTGVEPPPGTKVFQIPIEFGGVTVTDEAFVDQIHSDGYAVHIWTINDEPTMNELLDWDVDGIMTAEPMRLERVLCRRGTSRPPGPSRFGGRHCSRRASIACDVEAAQVDRKGHRARIVLKRHDEFDSRCAGRLALKALDTGARRKARFSFGWAPPSGGGPKRLSATIKLPPGLRSAVRPGDDVRVLVRPYSGFVSRARLAVG